jgi:Putative auto-transporter adhesin, head GIN domain
MFVMNWKAGIIEGSCIMISEKREVSSFNSIDIRGAYVVEITSQKTPSIEVIGDANILPLVKTKVKDGTLFISNSKSIVSTNILKIKVAIMNLEKLSSSGACRIVVFNVNNEKISINANGSGYTAINGRTEELYLNISGSVNLNAKYLYSEKVNIDLSGASNTSVYAAQELNAQVSGVGHINYYGNPKVVNRNVLGLGSISNGLKTP